MRKIIVLGIIGSFWFLQSYACYTLYDFYLDTSAQNYTVVINKPDFKPNIQYDFNKYVTCITNSGSIPIRINGMGRGWYQCTQSNTLDLQPNSWYILSNTIEIDANNQSILIPDDSYLYAPWDSSGKTYPHTYLIYFDNNGKLSYRIV